LGSAFWPHTRWLAALVLGLALGSLPAVAHAEAFLSRKEALALAFPQASVREHSVLLDDAQAEIVRQRTGMVLESRLATLYTGIRSGAVTGYAFIDLHTVRTRPEALMVVLWPDGRVRSLHLLAFYEPPEYRPMDRWLVQFDGRKLDSSLRIGGQIHGIAGATLSSRAVTGGVRRSLALYDLLVGPLPRPTNGPVASVTAKPVGGARAGGQ